MADGNVNDVSHDLLVLPLLSSEDRDFLIRNNGDQVIITNLTRKIVGLYFSGSWCWRCRHFTPSFVEIYQEVASKGDFEVVFISSDRDEESFNGYFSEMPWLAIPFSDSDTRKSLKELFNVRGIPNLVFIDTDGKVSTQHGVRIVREYGVDGYLFTLERLNFLKEEEEAAKKNQSLSSILVSSSRDYLVSNDGNQVLVSELEGKMVGLYFSVNSHGPCREFTPTLVDVYKKLKEKGENFDVVLILLDHQEEEFKQGFEALPWLALPFKDKTNEKLVRCFNVKQLPTLVIIGPDGKTLNPNVAELVEEHGVESYPFTPEKLVELAEIEKAKQEAQLESLLVSEHKDFVIEKSGSKIQFLIPIISKIPSFLFGQGPVSELVGKNILLYFSAHWCPPCCVFLPKLIKTYHDIKAKDEAFEVIFISSDRNQSSFDDFFATMPWLTLPFGDERKKSLQRKFKVQGIPAVIAIDRFGRTANKDARQAIAVHGPNAYPFSEEHIKHLEEKIEEMAKGWPEKVKSQLHVEHELVLICSTSFRCDGCKEPGYGWSFCCKECNFGLHPNCALKKDEEETKDDHEKAEEGFVCDGDVCRRA